MGGREHRAWRYRQYGQGCLAPLVLGVSEQFFRGEHDCSSNLERGPFGSGLHDSVLSTLASALVKSYREWNGVPPPTSLHCAPPDPLPGPLTPAGCSSAQVFKPPSGAAFPIPPPAVSLRPTAGFSRPSAPLTQGNKTNSYYLKKCMYSRMCQALGKRCYMPMNSLYQF